MRTLLALWVVAASVTLADAQPVDPPQTTPPAKVTPAAPAKITHFLIDASGSMEKRLGKLDTALRAKRAEVAQAGLPPPIETRFGGDNGGTCAEPVQIGRVETGAFRNDNSQIGAALEAALNSVGSSNADIFIFTDEEQTPGCGPDICTVAERYLPKAGIFVQSIAIDASPVDHIRTSCVRSAQDRPALPAPFNISINIDQIAPAGNATEYPVTSSDPFAAFFEKWLWLIALGCVAGSAILWGLQNLRAALKLETRTQKLEQLQFAALVDNNEVAAKKLRAEIESINTTRNADEARKAKLQAQPKWQRRRTKARYAFAQIRWHGIGIAGSLILLALIFFPSSLSIESFNTGRAQSLAWFALDSSFAEAFSLIGIALVFFAGSQHRRRLEAEEKNGLASDKALWADGRLRAKHRTKVTDDYNQAQKNLAELEFPPPTYRRRGNRSTSFADRSAVVDFTVAIAEAKRIASGPELAFASIQDEDIVAQTQLISEIVSAARSGWPYQIARPPVARFVNAITKARSTTIEPSQLDLWTRWGKSLDRPNSESARSIAHQIAELVLLNDSSKSDRDKSASEKGDA
jgi:hypothetical protein